MTNSNSLIWVLADNSPGNYSQAIGLASILERPYDIKKINYNFFSNLPNCLKLNGLLGVDKTTEEALLNQKNKPKIIISAGRRTAPISLLLKKHYKDVFLIHIMNPRLNINKFDLVIMPKHDLFSKHDNIITSIGALGRINNNLLKEEYKKFAADLTKIKSTKIALLVGGSSKKGKFTTEIIDNLAKICSNITNNMNASLLVTTSKRTENNISLRLKNNLKCDHYFFQWQADKPNPYFAFLQGADYIIVTGDSMSMCSESCSTGKPVYIYNPKLICSDKHLRFHKNLFDEKCAKKLDLNIKKLESEFVNKLDETSRIGKKVNELLISKSL